MNWGESQHGKTGTVIGNNPDAFSGLTVSVEYGAPLGSLMTNSYAESELAYLYSSCAAAEVDNLAAEYGAPKAKFKVGDRVRRINHDNNPTMVVGTEWTVAKLKKYCDDDYLEFEGGEDGNAINFEHVAVAPATATLQIQAGKFYKTRDGRKVGPMEAWDSAVTHKWQEVGGSNNFNGGGDIWRDDGTSHYSPNLVAEWTDEPAATAGGAKFKVGDKVKNTKVPEAGVGTVTEVRGDGEYQVNYADTWYGYCTDYDSDMVAAPTSIADIVARHSQTGTAIVCLLENGKPKPSTVPFVHGSTYLAATEATRLANVHKGKEFGVYTLGEVKKVERTFDHEWQRLAVKPTKSDAIAEFKRLTGCTTAQARRIVYDFAEAA
jgi:hypothetical protein